MPGLVAIGLLAGSFLASGGGSATGRSGLTSARASRLVSAPGARRASRGVTAGIVANAERGRTIVYRTPGGSPPWRRFSNPTAQRTPLVFLVRERRGAWLRVLLPSRPNGSQGWIRADAVELRSDPYAVRVELARRRLVVFDANRVLLTAPIGLGRAATPTPAGLYYVTELLRQPNPAGSYGPWAFALSAHSSVLSHFGGGDGQVGIHGTDDPSGIGHTVSHGCIRVRNAVIEHLAAILPLGTPVRILAGARPIGTRSSSRRRKNGVSRS